MEKSYKYLGYFLLILYPLTLVGFHQTYFSLYPTFEGIQITHHIHGAIAFLWISMLVIQPILIQAKKIEMHRRLGKLSYLLFPLLILSFLPMLAIQFKNTGVKSAFVPMADMALLIFFYALAIINRKNIPYHMRYMIASALVFIDPTVARMLIPVFGMSDLNWFHIIFGIIYAILLGLIFYDIANKRNYKPYIVSLLAFLVYQIGFHINYIYPNLEY